MEMTEVVELLELERLAVAGMPDAVRVVAENGTGVGNQAAWDRWALRPRALQDVGAIATSTTVLGQRIEVPVVVAPFALQALCHPEGEVATSRGSAGAGTIMTLSLATTRAPEEMEPGPSGFWMNLQFLTDRGLMEEVVQRAAAAGATAICLTVDLPVAPWWPAAMRQALVSIQLEWTACFFGRRAEHAGQRPNWDHRVIDASATWSDLEWLRGVSPLPVILKGIMTVEDARLAVDHGAAAVVVSNHGGHALVQSLPTADVLPEIAEAIDGRIEVLVDGGIRSGAHVLCALALGARAVLVGRPALWGLSVDGADGIRRVLELLRDELAVVMALTGTRSVGDIDRTRIARRS
jgi:4-hydroxymandelate oxidase